MAEDLAAARTPAETAERERLSVTPARIHAEVDQLERALGEATRGTPAADIAAYHAAQVQGLATAQVQQEVRRRDAAVAAMEALRRRLHPLALAVGVTAPLVLAGLYLGALPAALRAARRGGGGGGGAGGRGSSAGAERPRRARAAAGAGAPGGGAGGARPGAAQCHRRRADGGAERGQRPAGADRRGAAAVLRRRGPRAPHAADGDPRRGRARRRACRRRGAGELCHDQGPGAAALHPDRESAAHRTVGERATRARAAPGRPGRRWRRRPWPTPRRCWRGRG